MAHRAKRAAWHLLHEHPACPTSPHTRCPRALMQACCWPWVQIGAGIMALPRTFATLGILLGTTMMGLVFGLSYFSLFALIRCEAVCQNSGLFLCGYSLASQASCSIYLCATPGSLLAMLHCSTDPNAVHSRPSTLACSPTGNTHQVLRSCCSYLS